MRNAIPRFTANDYTSPTSIASSPLLPFDVAEFDVKFFSVFFFSRLFRLRMLIVLVCMTRRDEWQTCCRDTTTATGGPPSMMCLAS